MLKNITKPSLYSKVSEHFALKGRQRTAMDFMDALAFEEVMAAAEDGDYAEAGKILTEAGIITADAPH